MDLNDALLIIYLIISFLPIILAGLYNGGLKLKETWIAKKQAPHGANVIFLLIFLFFANGIVQNISAGCVPFGSDDRIYCFNENAWQFVATVMIGVNIAFLCLMAGISTVKKKKEN